MDVYTTLNCVVRARAGTSAGADGPTIPVDCADAAKVVSGVSAAASARTAANASAPNEDTILAIPYFTTCAASVTWSF